MTTFSRRFAPSLPVRSLLGVTMSLLMLAACGADPQPAPHSSASTKARPDAQAQARSAALAGREQALLDWLKKALEKPAHADVYKAAVEQARGRAEHCPSARCITRALDRREARLNFAEGKEARIPGLPFPLGRFARADEGYSGTVRIVPLVDGKAMLVVSMAFRNRPSCRLDGVMSRDDRTSTWTVSSLEEGLPTLVLTPVGEQAFDLSYAEAGHQPHQVDYCTAGTGIDGRYALES